MILGANLAGMSSLQNIIRPQAVQQGIASHLTSIKGMESAQIPLNEVWLHGRLWAIFAEGLFQPRYNTNHSQHIQPGAWNLEARRLRRRRTASNALLAYDEPVFAKLERGWKTHPDVTLKLRGNPTAHGLTTLIDHHKNPSGCPWLFTGLSTV